MMQIAFINLGATTIQLEFPQESNEVLPGVPWGNVAGFPTPAYWAYRVLERRIEKKPIQYKVGKTLIEELAACLLGGHGIPASMGLAAFEHLKLKGALTGEVHSEDKLLEWLSEPIAHNNKLSKYRFAKQKAKYLYSALSYLALNDIPDLNGRELRNWLLPIKGIGPKTASWIARNWLDADDVAILDIHIYRAGLLAKFFTAEMTIEKNYFELEERFLHLATALGVSASELDAVMWHEMQNTRSIPRLLAELTDKTTNKSNFLTHKSQTEPKQFAFA